MKIRGAAWKFGDNINTDLIFPNHFFKPAYEPGEMGAALLRGADPDFPSKFRAGDIIVAGRNFGCGSSREEAAGAMKEAGVGAIVASSFGRLFMRNCINLGVPVATCSASRRTRTRATNCPSTSPAVNCSTRPAESGLVPDDGARTAAPAK